MTEKTHRIRKHENGMGKKSYAGTCDYKGEI